MNIQVLTHGDFVPHSVKLASCASNNGGGADVAQSLGHQLGAPSQKQVANHECRGLAVMGRVTSETTIRVVGLEMPVRGRTASPGVGAVHDVVVY